MSFLSGILSKIKPGSGDNAPTQDIKSAQSELQKAMGPLQAAIDAQKVQKAENERLAAERAEQYAKQEAERQVSLTEKAAELTGKVDSTEGQLTLGDEIRSARLEEIQDQLELSHTEEAPAQDDPAGGIIATPATEATRTDPASTMARAKPSANTEPVPDAPVTVSSASEAAEQLDMSTSTEQADIPDDEKPQLKL